MSTTTSATLVKKSVKTQCCNKKSDLVKLREDLRQRCKLRMREKRQELLNERRFGVSSDKDVQDKLMKIFEEELTELAVTKNYEVLEGTADNIKKFINSEHPVEPVTEEEKIIVEEFQKLKEEETSTLLKEES
ncbi:uncharacterized protein LOC131672092 [Phymastichus coffea]|uniref:uncharacterized protein LOC131672092 n=1 Tax=Phymastichus coffea TaxID=108790 RepID=UPI00273BA19E|nr:uncharacterized protein LOC131672092 [Phymastichus coffea]